MAKNNIYVDVIYDYIVLGNAQSTIADEYDLTQQEVSKMLTKDYDFNKGNTAWGTGKNNQKGQYSNLSYEDIQDFVDSDYTDIDKWLKNSGSDSDDDYEDDDEEYEDDEYDEDEESDNTSNSKNSNYSNSGNYSTSSYHNNHNNYKKSNQRRNSNQLSLGLSDDTLGFIAVGIIAFILFILLKIKQSIPIVKLYISVWLAGNYLILAFSCAIINIIVKWIMRRDLISPFKEKSTYVMLGLGFVASGIKLMYDFGSVIGYSLSNCGPGLVLFVIGAIILLICKRIEE